MNKFIWDNDVRIIEKIDGSLILLFKYQDNWFVNTRGSFAQGELNFTGKSWSDWVWEAIPDKDAVQKLDSKFTYVMEFVSPYNKVVRLYPVPQLYLLSVIETETGNESFSETEMDNIANRLGILRPKRFQFSDFDAIKAYLLDNGKNDPTFEGFVLVDKNKNRIKFKSETYVNLHHLHDNGNIFNPSRLVPLVLNGERDEIISYFPEVTESFDSVKEKVNKAYMELENVWRETHQIENQKEFALSIVGKTPFTGLLFNLRKGNKSQTVDDLKLAWRNNADGICKMLF